MGACMSLGCPRPRGHGGLNQRFYGTELRGVGAVKEAQWVKCMLFKCEDLSLDHQYTDKIWA